MTKRRMASNSNRSGSALVTVLVVSVIVCSVTALAIGLAMFRFRIINHTIAMEQALAVAEGGAEIIVSKIAESMATGGSQPAAIGSGTVGGHTFTYQYVGSKLESTATIRGVTRKVTLDGLGLGYWSKYLYFANYYNIPNSNGSPGSPIWFISGDYLDGPVHCNHDIYVYGSPVFVDEVTLSGEIVEGGGYNPVFSNASSPQIVETLDMQSINFDILKANATANGLTFVGATDIEIDGDQMTVVNNGATNTYTIGSGSDNIVYVSNGSVPYGGTGSWVDQEVTNEVSYWAPGYTVTNVSEGRWDDGTWQGGYEPDGWYNRNGMTYRYVGFSYWYYDFIYQRDNGWSYYAYTWRSRWVEEIISYDGDQPDYKLEAHREYDAKPKSWAGWDLAYKNSHRRYEWIPGSNIVTTVNSNLVTITTNYTDQVWVEDTNATQDVNGDVTIQGTLTEGVTIVADRHITVTGDLVYSNKPGRPAYTNAASDVMCGLISGGDVIVDNPNPYAHEDRTIHASIMATGTKTGADEGDPYGLDGRFIVEDYNRGTHKGILHVYGGIIQNWRGPVGTFSGGSPSTGFTKDYVYDFRFGEGHGKAPPGCPLINVEFNFASWAEGPGS